MKGVHDMEYRLAQIRREIENCKDEQILSQLLAERDSIIAQLPRKSVNYTIEAMREHMLY